MKQIVDELAKLNIISKNNMESAYPVPGRGLNDKSKFIQSNLTPAELLKQADEIENTMLEHARNLEFEDAANIAQG